MGNQSNPEQWAAFERLRFIERAAFWSGILNRSDVQDVFGVSQAQASADLQRYLQINPSSLTYHLSRKRYEGSKNLKCILHQPHLVEAMSCFLGETGLPLTVLPMREEGSAPLIDIAARALPVRDASLDVQREVFRAVLHRRRLKIHYYSVSGAKNTWRYIAPRGFGHDGYRWHVRAWCETNFGFRDFVLSRMKEAEAIEELADVPEDDTEWDTFEEIVLSPGSKLSEDQQKAIALDFGMRNNKMRLRVRKAMLDYVMTHLNLPFPDGRERAPLLELANSKKG